jgi:caffeoyl-CoA O-methyltransferase
MEKRPIADTELETYAAAHSTAVPTWLESVAETTRAFSADHGMMVGSLEGGLLAMLVAISGARRVLEIGTFTGYSALAMAQALPPGGRIVTCEAHPDHARQARANFEASAYAGLIELREGPAIDTIRALDGPFDLVFIDADKPAYASYYEAVLSRLADRGLIAVDNTLWSGRILDPAGGDANTRAIAAFNDMVAADPRVECVVLTVRDGLTLIRRRAGA